MLTTTDKRVLLQEVTPGIQIPFELVDPSYLETVSRNNQNTRLQQHQSTGDLFQAILIAGMAAGAVSDDKLRFKQEFSPRTVVLGCNDGMYAYSFLTKMAG